MIKTKEIKKEIKNSYKVIRKYFCKLCDNEGLDVRKKDKKEIKSLRESINLLETMLSYLDNELIRCENTENK